MAAPTSPGGEQHSQERRMVRSQPRHPVAGLHPEPPRAVGQAPHPLGQVRIGEGAVRAHEHQLTRVGPGAALDPGADPEARPRRWDRVHGQGYAQTGRRRQASAATIRGGCREVGEPGRRSAASAGRDDRSRRRPPQNAAAQARQEPGPAWRRLRSVRGPPSTSSSASNHSPEDELTESVDQGLSARPPDSCSPCV